MKKQTNNLKQPLNNKKSKLIENSKNDKSLGSTTYSKNKKILDKMLREYQSFCKKYFGESTPIGSMTEERMNKLLEDEENINNKNKVINLLDNNENSSQYFDIFNDDNENIIFNLENKDIFNQLPNDLNYSENNRLGNNKNNKNDYIRRFNNIFEKEKKDEKDINNKQNNKKDNDNNNNNKDNMNNNKDNMNNNKDNNNKANNNKDDNNKEDEEYNDFEEENIEEIKNKKANIIQKFYKRKKLNRKNLIYFGYDKTKKNLLWIYTDKLDSKNNLKIIRIKCYSMEQKKEFLINKNIKDLLNIDSITEDKIKKKEIIDELIDKIDKILEKNDKKDFNNLSELNKNKNNNVNKNNVDEEKVVDEDGNEYTF